MYESIYKSLQRIRNKKDRADAYDTICAYALYNTEPDLSTASDSVAIAFELTRPVLDSARKRAENGKQGGSKPKAKAKQTQREKENEEEKEVEIEMEKEIEIEKESLSLSGAGGDIAGAREASEEELASIGLKPGEYPLVTGGMVSATVESARTLFGKYVHREPTALDCKMAFMYCSVGEYGLLDYAFQSASLAGKADDWRYIRGIMDRLHARDIHTPEEAYEWDLERPDREE